MYYVFVYMYVCICGYILRGNIDVCMYVYFCKYRYIPQPLLILLPTHIPLKILQSQLTLSSPLPPSLTLPLPLLLSNTNATTYLLPNSIVRVITIDFAVTHTILTETQ